MNVKIIAGMLFLVLLFVVAIGSQFFLGMQKTSSIHTMDDPPSHMKNRLRDRFKETSRKSLSKVPQNIAFDNYMAGLASDRIEREEKQRKKEERSRVSTFLKTEAGQYLDEGIKMLKSGRREEARNYIRMALDLHHQYDEAIYMIMLKTLLHSYVKEDDRKELDEKVLRYLKIIRNEYDFEKFESVVQDVIDKIEEKVLNGE
jgi:hypothetical protein